MAWRKVGVTPQVAFQYRPRGAGEEATWGLEASACLRGRRSLRNWGQGVGGGGRMGLEVQEGFRYRGNWAFDLCLEWNGSLRKESPWGGMSAWFTL